MGEPEPIAVDMAQLADIEIEELGLSALINDHLAVCHIATAADLCQMLQRLPGVVPLFIRRHICFFDRCIDEVIQNIETNASFDLLEYQRHLATWSDLFAVCDEDVPASLYPDLVHLMHDILSSEDDAREWQIFSKRYGIAGEAPHTLEELGKEVNLTRERVRQLESPAIKKLTNFLFKKPIYDCLEAGFSTKPIRWIREFACSLRAQQLIWGESTLIDHVLTSLELTRTAETMRFVKCILEMMGCIPVFSLNGVRVLRIGQLWTFYLPLQRTIFAEVITDIQLHLATNYTQQYTFAELYDRAQKMWEVHTYRSALPVFSTGLFQALIDRCDAITACGDGVYWIDTAFIASRSNQISRIFAEQQRPMHINEIQQIIVGMKSQYLRNDISTMNIGNYLSSDERFESAGRSGLWALQSMQIETATIQDLMVRCLAEYAVPQTADALYAYVVALRPVSLHSITIYLSLADSPFIAEKENTWGLLDWVDPLVRQQREQLATYVIDYFRSLHKTQVALQQLALTLVMRHNLDYHELLDGLSQLPVLRITSISGTKYAVLRQRWRDITPRTNTIEARMHQRIIEILQALPTQEIALPTLLSTLHSEFSCSEHTYYSYISRCPQIERYTNESRVRMVALHKPDASA